MSRNPFGPSSPAPRNYAAGILLLCSQSFLFAASFYGAHPQAHPGGPIAPIRERTFWLGSEESTSTVIESIPAKYRKRYQQWKQEYLDTETGRNEWVQYVFNPDFALTIKVSKEEGQGARIAGLRWDENGKLIAATIILGKQIDSGYPNATNYPITCSLAPGNLPPEVKGKILASTKLAHEFGHLDQITAMDGRLYQLQNELMIEYNKIFHTNGFNVQDPRLLELAGRMGGTPVSIAQEREHWAEMGAIHYLLERLPELSGKRAKLPASIRQAIDAYYLTYPDRFQN